MQNRGLKHHSFLLSFPYLAQSEHDAAVTLEARLSESCVLDDVHVVKPGVLHAPCEITADLDPVSSGDEVVDPSKMYLEPEREKDLVSEWVGRGKRCQINGRGQIKIGAQLERVM